MANRFQPLSFKTIDDFLCFLPDGELKITEALRSMVLECLPDAKEKLGYNVPFFYRHSRICFIWPGSVPWGKKEKKGVEFGFCKGHLLADSSYLETGSRKEVYIKTFHSLKEIDWELMRSLVYEAATIDEEAFLKKTKKRIS